MTESIDEAFRELIEEIQLKADLGRQEATGFYTVYCPICHKESRKTAGFKFTEEEIIFNCFRGSCDGSCGYEKGGYISKKFRKLMDSYSIKIPVSLKVNNKSKLRKELDNLDESLYKKHFYKEVFLPEYFVPIEESSKSYADKWVNKLKERKILVESLLIVESGVYAGYPVIPFYYFDKLVGYQIITNNKYITFSEGNSHLIYCPECYFDNPVILVEGTLDALCFPNTVATLRKDITKEQAYFLRGKDVIMVPDKEGNHFIEQYKQYGWRFSLPSWEVKDLNAAVIKYGVMVAARKIFEGIVDSSLEAEIKYKQWRW